MRVRPLLVATLALLVGVATAGIAAAGQASLSKSEYIKAADDICRQSSQLQNELADDVFAGLGRNDKPSDAQLAEYADGLVPIAEQTLDSLRGLPKPKGDAKKLNKIYKLVEKAFQKIEDDPSALLAEPPVTEKADKLGRAYGFKVCGS